MNSPATWNKKTWRPSWNHGLLPLATWPQTLTPVHYNICLQKQKADCRVCIRKISIACSPHLVAWEYNTRVETERGPRAFRNYLDLDLWHGEYIFSLLVSSMLGCYSRKIPASRILVSAPVWGQEAESEKTAEQRRNPPCLSSSEWMGPNTGKVMPYSIYNSEVKVIQKRP